MLFIKLHLSSPVIGYFAFACTNAIIFCARSSASGGNRGDVVVHFIFTHKARILSVSFFRLLHSPDDSRGRAKAVEILFLRIIQSFANSRLYTLTPRAIRLVIIA